ncbi:MAG: hypothetical protein GX222_08315 [Ruminococcaceae bacterium]|nr:hypothetical protein [Oscillospiraceae bacterium]
MNKKKILQQKFLVAVFLVFLIAPMIVHLFVKDTIDTENREKRELVQFSEVAAAPLRSKPYVFQQYFNDHLPFKNQLVAVNSLVSMRLFHTTASPLVLVGEKNWLFFNNIGADNPIDDVLGITTYSEEDLKLAAENIERRRENLESQGIELYVMVVPNKEAAYFEYLPGYIQEKVAEKSRTDELAEYLVKNGVDIVYPKQELLAAKEKNQVYYKYDTHWNHLGAYTGVRELYSCMGISLPALDSYKVTTGAPSKDLADLAGIGTFCEDDVSYWTEGFGEGIGYKAEYLDHGYVRYTSDSEDNRTVLVIGDSYFGSMQPYFYLQFGEVIEINRNAAKYNPDELIARYRPDIVVLQIVERASSVLLHEDILK